MCAAWYAHLERGAAALAELDDGAVRQLRARIGRNSVHRDVGRAEQIERPIAGGFSRQREMATRHDRRIGGIRDPAIELASEHDAIQIRLDPIFPAGERSRQMSNDEHDRFLLSTGHPVGLFGSHL